MAHLIANSGIHFITTEMELNPQQPLQLGNGRILRYSFVEMINFVNSTKELDLLYTHSSGAYIALKQLRQTPNDIVKRADGSCDVDELGVLKMRADAAVNAYNTFNDNDPQKFDISTLQGYMVRNPQNPQQLLPAYELLLGHWLPVPMYEVEQGGSTATYPLGWCRVKIERVPQPKDDQSVKKGSERFRFIWAFDTELADPNDFVSVLRPRFWNNGPESKDYAICRRADDLLGFMSTDQHFSAYSEYIYRLLGLDKTMATAPDTLETKYIGYYIYLINYLRLCGAAPDITLHRNDPKTDVPVDLVLDIGNSRTCGVLFENGDFTTSEMLRLRDMTHPERDYDKPFDMRVVFRMADFGNDMVLDDSNLFQWKSFVRVGEEAKSLLYRTNGDAGLAQRTTGYSSPKRYLWDDKPFGGNWENLIVVDDAYNVQAAQRIYISGLSTLFDTNGEYIPRAEKKAGYSIANADTKNFSRSSLMTMALIEIMQQAMAQINSVSFRNKHGNEDLRRVLRNIILTSPTAMPRAEQIRLRECAEDAYDALRRNIKDLGNVNIYPSSASLRNVGPTATGPKMWSYDEASCCQLVYLYAEIAERYKGEIQKFFELKGHVRPEDKTDGYEGNSLTIGSIDIGAGTTDVMVCSYRRTGNGGNMITPRPLYWDSFYLAGDDILHNMVQNLVIEGPHHGNPNMGNISGALVARLMNMTNEQLRALPCLHGNPVYQNAVDNIILCLNPQSRESQIRAFASNLLHDFFDEDHAMMTAEARRNRLDFNTQVSVPLMQFFLEELRQKHATRCFKFNDIFSTNVPADYLLDYFEHHFGFRFEELEWRFNPEEVANMVKSTMEPLLKQMAILLYVEKCDVIVLAGRPTSLDAITELFIKYIPISPDRLVRLNEYRVGSFFPTANGQGYFYDHKSIVAVGAMIGFLGQQGAFPNFALDFSTMIRDMHSTANYIGLYNTDRRQVNQSLITPTEAFINLDVHSFPVFLGCRQFDSATYQARPIYAIYNHSSRPTLQMSIMRDPLDSELLTLDSARDNQGNNVPLSQVELVRQSLVDDGKHWLDKGAFHLYV
jgi:hypothetical protein